MRPAIKTIGAVLSVAAAVCLLLCLPLAGCRKQGEEKRAAGGAAENAAKADNAVAAAAGVVAVINGEKLSAQELQWFTEEMVSGFEGTTRTEWSEAIDTLINNRTLARKAVAEKVSEIPRVASKSRSVGYPLWQDVYWSEVVVPGVKVTEEDFAKSAPRFEDLLTVRQMVVSDRAQAEALRRQAVGDPGSFEALVKSKSEGLTAEKGGIAMNVTRNAPHYGKEILDVLFSLKRGEFSPVLESPIGYTFFQLLERISADEARKEWRKTAAEPVRKKKADETWEKRLDALARTHRIKTYDKDIERYVRARDGGKDLTSLAGKPAFTIDNAAFFFQDLADPSQMGVVHGRKTLEVIIKKRISEYVVDAEMERLGLKDHFPKLKAIERFRRENVLARAYIDYRCRGIKVSKGDVEKYYRENRAKFERPAALDISAIETQSEARLKSIYESLAAGEDFAAVAAKWGDNAKKYPGGRVGLIPEDKLSPELAKVKSLKAGQYLREPIVLPLPEKKDGKLYVVLRLNAVRPKGVASFAEVDKGDLEKAVTAHAREAVVNAVLGELRKENQVEITKGYVPYVDAEVAKKKAAGGKNVKHP